MRKCPVCDWEIKDAGVAAEVNGRKVIYCCKECADKAKAAAKGGARK